MNEPSWVRPEEGISEPAVAESRSPILVSLHFLLAALRRRWLACVMSAVLGLLVAAGFMLLFPPSYEARTTLIMSHDPQLDPTRAMSTDVALLQTRTVASETIAKLGLAMTPEEFQGTVTAVPISSELLSIQLKAPTGDEAVRQLGMLSSTYLGFRAQQLTLQSDSTVDGLQKQIDQLNSQVKALSKRIEKLSTSASNSSELGDAISQRANAQSRIETLTQSIEDAKLKTSTIVSASRVVDPAAIEPGLALRGLVLGLASGLIGGAALGCGTVLFFAIVSTRIRRRSDVAEALGVPVTVSVGRLTPLRPIWRRTPVLRRIERRRAIDRERLAYAIIAQLSAAGRRSVVVACVDNASEVGFALTAAIARLTSRGQIITLIDLTESGAVDPDQMSSIKDDTGQATVLRPKGVPALAATMEDLAVAGEIQYEGVTHTPDTADATLILAELDPAVGADHLKAWSDRVLAVVTAGRSSAERLRTVGDLIRSARLDFHAAALVRAEESDDSSGVAVVIPAQPSAGREEQIQTASSRRAEAQ